MKSFLTAVALLMVFLFCFAREANAATTWVNGTIPLEIRDLSITEITPSSALVSWNTNGDATSQVFYSPVSGNLTFQTAIYDTLYKTTSHRIIISGLTSTTTYRCRAQSLMATEDGALSAVSGDVFFTTLPEKTGPHYVGNTSVEIPFTISGLTSPVSLATDKTGTILDDAKLVSPDHGVNLSIPRGTKLSDAVGKPLTTISVVKATGNPDPPLGKLVITAYNFGPPGSTFDPPIWLTLNYDPEMFPPYFRVDSLTVAWWDNANWKMLDSQVDLIYRTVSTRVNHFSIYALVVGLNSSTGPEILKDEIPPITGSIAMIELPSVCPDNQAVEPVAGLPEPPANFPLPGVILFLIILVLVILLLIVYDKIVYFRF